MELRSNCANLVHDISYEILRHGVSEKSLYEIRGRLGSKAQPVEVLRMMTKMGVLSVGKEFQELLYMQGINERSITPVPDRRLAMIIFAPYDSTTSIRDTFASYSIDQLIDMSIKKLRTLR